MVLAQSSEKPSIWRKPRRSAWCVRISSCIAAWRGCSRSRARRGFFSSVQSQSEQIDVDRPHLDAMLLRVAHELRRRIKAHRLAVEQRRGEHIGVMAFDPGRGIDQDREARGVAFGKAVFAEALDLLEAVAPRIRDRSRARSCHR